MEPNALQTVRTVGVNQVKPFGCDNNCQCCSYGLQWSLNKAGPGFCSAVPKGVPRRDCDLSVA